MKKLILSIFALCCMAMAASSATKVYINPGHGSWGPNCRPVATINYAAGDTLGFFESNTNLWKAFAMEEKLLANGFAVKLSRRASGGSGTNEWNKALSTICTEATNYAANYYISIHSNAGPVGELGNASKFANYPVMLYRGYTGSPKVTNSDKMAKKCVARLYEAFWTTPKSPSGGGGPEPTTYYSPSNPDVIGDLSFYNTTSTYGYLGALKHERPGFLSEGYFHTYSPARHRALNTDWCRQEGIRYFRGVMDYYGKAGETVGYIMGYVRSKSETFSHAQYIPYPGSNDQYKPINGAKIVLRNEKGDVIKCNCYPYVKRMKKNQSYYTTDHNYNGIFMFENLAPGKYTLYVHASGYKDVVQTVTVKADKTIYPEIFMTKGTGTEPNIAPADPDIKWELNGGRVPGGTAPTNAELWEAFKPYYNTYYGLNRSDQTIENVATFAASYMQDIMTNSKSEYKWLGTYIKEVATAQGYALDSESAWRWHVHAFFNKNDGTVTGNQKVKTADFSTAGKPAKWKNDYFIAKGMNATLPYSVTSEYTLPTNVIKDGYDFVGWFDNAAGTGSALKTIPAGWKGTLYAIWKLPGDVTWQLNGGTVSVTLPTEITGSAYTIPTPTRSLYIFLGWYDTNDTSGNKLTSLPVGYKGTVYAIWREAKVTWVLNGGKVMQEQTTPSTTIPATVPTNDSLWTAFKPYYNKYYGLNRSDQPITAVSSFADTKMCEIMTKTNSEYKWLGDYIIKVAKDQGYTLTSDPAAENMEGLWRWHVHHFFNCSQRTETWLPTANFATAGKPSAWGSAYQAAYPGTTVEGKTEIVEVTLPTTIKSTYTIPTPVKDGYEFLGWYDTNDTDGNQLTTLPAGYDGTVYAIWNETPADVKWELNGGQVSGNLPTEITDSDYTIPTPVKEGYVFLGWYDNAEGTGNAITVLPVGYKGKLYALWREAVVTWELNGGKVLKEVTVTVPGKEVAVPSQEELWTKFQAAAGLSLGTLADIKTAGGSNPHSDPNTPCGCRVICTKLTATEVQAVFAKAEWKWLQTYIMSVQTSLTDDLTAAAWRYAIAAFFLQTEHNSWPASADFTTAGKPSAWGSAYQKANGATESTTTTTYEEVSLPSKITGSPYTIPTPTKDGDEFVGWYDNANGTGVALTVLPVGYDGTVYAIWKSGIVTDVESVVRPSLDMDAPMYDILGRRVDGTYRGIIIQNGNKYLLR